ncbi:hypothetical protein ACTA71_006402 [Dictyostelium dimigraforme]
MDNIIYSYLINNYNNKDSEEFLNCLLILSINNLNITFTQLQDYCNGIINSDNNKIHLERKRKVLDEEDQKNELKGLNNQQFQILNNHVQILNNTFIDNANQDIIYTHSITNYIINNNKINDTTISINKRIAFDCSILIIINNNLNHLINNNINNDNGNINKNLNKIILKSPQLVAKMDRNDQQYNYYLFKKVWGNMIIRETISFHLRIYNNSLGFGPRDLSNYKYRNYTRFMTWY